MIIHFDNAPPHKGADTTEFLNFHGIIKAPHPPYSPDIAPSDFYLFGYIKALLAGRSFKSPQDLLDNVIEILSEIPKSTLLKVFNQWETRLQKVIASNGEFIE